MNCSVDETRNHDTNEVDGVVNEQSGVNGDVTNGDMKNGDCDGEKMDKETALSSLGSLGKIPGQIESAGLPSEDDAGSVFKFSSQDVTTYQSEDQSLFTEALGSLSLMPEDEVTVDTPSTSGSVKPPSEAEAGAEGNRSRRGSKNQKKSRKPPKSLSVTSPKTQSGRRAAAAADLANTAILSPHTPKWRSEAVSSAGCLIHSKAINVKFLLENYLCMKCDFAEKHYDNDWRGFLPHKSEIIARSSTAHCELPETPDKMCLSRFVSHGFIANSSDQDPLAGKRTPPEIPAPSQTTSSSSCRKDVKIEQPSCESPPCVVAPSDVSQNNIPRPEQKPTESCCKSEDASLDDPACNSVHSVGSSSQGRMCYSHSSVGAVRSGCCGGHAPHYRPLPGDVTELHREQSRDSGVFSHTPPYNYGACCAATMPPPCHWWHMQRQMCGATSMPPPHMCAPQQMFPPCTSPTMCGAPPMYGQPHCYGNQQQHYPQQQFGSCCEGRRHYRPERNSVPEMGNAQGSVDMHWNDVWEKAWGQ